MRIRARFRWLFLAGLALGLGLGYGGAELRRSRADRSAVETAQVFSNVLSAIRADFVDSLSDAELYARAAKGVVTTLGDPYSTFLGPEDFRAYRDLLKGRGRTYGLTFESGLTGLRIATVVAGTPADRAGLAPGDFVLGIGGEPTRLWTPDRATRTLAAAGGGVTVRVQTPGDSVPLAVELEPSSGRLPAVGLVSRLSDSVGYLKLNTVSDDAKEEVEDALERLDARKLRGLVLDLRGNVGGRLDEALAIADLFLAPGQRIGTVAKRRLRWGYQASSADVFPRLRIALLVDRKTASSAEIIAAALRDNGRAVLVGERTFGKGLIQTTFPLGDSAALRLTTGRWQGPGGRLIANGLEPDSATAPAEWEATLLRSLGFRTELLAETLGGVAARRLAGGVAPDSARLEPADREQLRARLREAGLTLSRRTIWRHAHWFDAEVARQVAAGSGQRELALKYGLLADPVVTAGLSIASRR